MMEEKSKKDVIEIIAATMLAFVSVWTSWSGYQSNAWSGIQYSFYARAEAARVESTKTYAEAMEFKSLDTNMFMQWLNAYAAEKHDLAEFYRNRFRREFRPAFEAWFATDPKNNPNALPSPLHHPEYRVGSSKAYWGLAQKAEDLFEKGQKANSIADKYIFNTVLLAVVMFFCGISVTFNNIRVRLVLLILAGGMLSYTFSSLWALPVAGGERPYSTIIL